MPGRSGPFSFGGYDYSSAGGDPGPRALLAAVDAVEAGGSASPELFEELCRRAAQSSLFS
ncbi:unnamed protein product [Cladocopium goreaui]|uniref:Potassium/sodium hyperpolarization-activated cyclic nucleotide-gated channel 4 n=1 Tax=Cladocopium goreaui TaxID=2562237 RepID=A0A9P1BIL9_9DINO|nr:unnamed protein product [Cladocopium goreaui]